MKFKEDKYLHLAKRTELLIDDIKTYYDEALDNNSDDNTLNRDLDKEDNLRVRIRDVYNRW